MTGAVASCSRKVVRRGVKKHVAAQVRAALQR